MPNPYDSFMRDLRKQSRHDKKLPRIQKWREYYRKAGPVVFAKEQLACPPDVPDHPTLGRPTYIILSQEQEAFLTDLFLGQKLSIVSAARGSGKTFVLAIFVCWIVACFDDVECTCMGGSQPQSEIIQRYIDYWRLKNTNLFYCIPKSTGGGKNPPRVTSRWGSTGIFYPCSPVSSRGPHVKIAIIDEVCAAEAKGQDGRKAVRSVWWQIVGKKDTQVILTSTAHFIFGTFYDYWSGKKKRGKLQFKKYRWGIAKHKSGETDPYKIYQDDDPDNWEPSVWWVTPDDIEILRSMKTNEEWLCEGLGGIGTASGMMFQRDDINFIVCDRKECKKCEPYTSNCPLVDEYGLGVNAKKVTERVGAVDWGETHDPNAIGILGRKGKRVFVLYAEELMSSVVGEQIDWAKDILNEWKIDAVYPDPNRRTFAQLLENMGFTVYYIWQLAGKTSHAKVELMVNVKRYMEKRLVIIPCCFEELINSLKGMTIGKDGKPIKHNDHSYDWFSYGLWEFKIDDSLSEFYKVRGRHIKDIW